MQTYQCHKRVQAAKIAHIQINDDTSAYITSARDSTICTKPGFAGKWKGTDEDPGYYVLYEDGYESWSPSKAFEEGYTVV